MKFTRAILYLTGCLAMLAILFPPMPRQVESTNGTYYYDFIAHASEASWSSGEGSLIFPGLDNDSRGFACYKETIELEDSVVYGRVLETHPDWDAYGHIQGTYPELTVMSGTELDIWIGFLDGAIGTDGVLFQVNFAYWSGGTRITSAVTAEHAYYDGHLDHFRFTLDSYAGKTGQFILYAGAGSSAGRDWAVWAQAEIRPVDTQPIVITECPLPDATVGEAYSVQLEAIGAEVPPYHWALIDGALPLGLNLNSDTGAISGTPTVAGASVFRINVCDSTELDGAHCSDLKDCYIQVNSPGITPAPTEEFDFNLDISTDEITLNLDPFLTGTSEVEAQITATVSLVSGIAKSIDLSLTGAPSGSNPYCLPSNGLSPFTAQCGFTAYVTNPPAVGDYDITLSATDGGITKSEIFTLHIARGVSGDLDIISVEPVQAIYGTDLVQGKGTVFRVKVHSTFSAPVETHLRLSLPDDEWGVNLPYVQPSTLPLDWEFPEFWGPVELSSGENELILPIVGAGDEEADFDTSLNPAGIIQGTCRGPVGSLYCHTDNRVVPRPIGDSLVTFTVQVDPYDVVSETNEWNNEHYSGASVVTTRAWKFLFIPYRYMEDGCTPASSFVRTGAQRQLEYLLAMFPIADSKITYSIAPYVTDWEEREGYPDYENRGDFLARISRLASSEGYDFTVGIGCGCGGGTMGSWVSAAFIGDCSGQYSHVLAHEFNHQVTGMGDFYSYGDCDWGVPYCELGTTQDNCPDGYTWDQCKDWCETGQGGTLYGCPDGRNVAPAADGFWVNRWIPISSQTSAYIMDSCTQSGSCTWTWMKLEDMRTCIDTGQCGHRLPDGTIVWGDIGHGDDTRGLENDGYLNLLASDKLVSEVDPEALLVSGRININGTASLDPFIYLPEATLDVAPGGEGDYYIVLLDENGGVLSKSGFEVGFYKLFCPTNPDFGPVDEVPFVYRIEWNEGTKRIELQDNESNVLSSREVSPNKPEIRVVYPNGGEVIVRGEKIEIEWEASDLDGDSLTYAIAISPDDAQTWLPLNIDIIDDKYEFSTEGLEEGHDYLVKVQVTDGVNTDTDMSDSVFTITESEAEREEGGISARLIIVVVITLVVIIGLALYFVLRPKRA